MNQGFQQQQQRQQQQRQQQQQQQRVQEQMQRQQQQMRDQMQRQRDMGGAWQSQKQAEAARQHQPARPQFSNDEFGRVEAQAYELRLDLAAGRISKKQFESRLEKLMVQDQAGSWWMVGMKSGEWYRYDGKRWVQGQPQRKMPSSRSAQPAARVQVQPRSTSDWSAPQAKPQRLTALVSVVIGLVVAMMVSGLVGILAMNILPGAGETEGLLIGGVVGLIVLVSTWRRAGRLWRGE